MLHSSNNNQTPRGILVCTIQRRLDSETDDKVRKETYSYHGHLYQHLMSMKKNHLVTAKYFWNNGGDYMYNAFKGLHNWLGYLLSEQGLNNGENVRNFFVWNMMMKDPCCAKPWPLFIFSLFLPCQCSVMCSVCCCLFFFYCYHIMDDSFPEQSVRPIHLWAYLI